MFAKGPILDVWQGSKYAYDSHDNVLALLRVSKIVDDEGIGSICHPCSANHFSFFHSKTIAFKEIFHPLVSWSVIVETCTLNFIFADILLNHFLKLK